MMFRNESALSTQANSIFGMQAVDRFTKEKSDNPTEMPAGTELADEQVGPTEEMADIFELFDRPLLADAVFVPNLHGIIFDADPGLTGEHHIPCDMEDCNELRTDAEAHRRDADAAEKAADDCWSQMDPSDQDIFEQFEECSRLTNAAIAESLKALEVQALIDEWCPGIAAGFSPPGCLNV